MHTVSWTLLMETSGKLIGSKAKCVIIPLSQVKYKIETVFNNWSAIHWLLRLLLEEVLDFTNIVIYKSENFGASAARLAYLEITLLVLLYSSINIGGSIQFYCNVVQVTAYIESNIVI